MLRLIASTLFLALWLVGQLVSGLVALLRLLPAIATGIRFVFRMILLGSRRLYQPILFHVNPWTRSLGVNLFAEAWRVAACVILSLLILGFLLLIFEWEVTIWHMVVTVGHGLYVGIFWDEAGALHDGIDMGRRL